MKKIFLGIFAVIALAACNQAGSSATKTEGAATVAATADKPIMNFERISHDFGKIKTGDVVKYDFKFINTGKSPLIITNATATCGCTRPDYPKAPIAPGAAGVIHVEFNSAGKMGLQDKQVTVTANTTPADNNVHLVGEVTAAATPATK